jgi:Ca2+-binding RTX toxin-like protein
MLTALRTTLKLVPALAAATAVTAVAAPSASADTVPTVWLNQQGVLSYTGVDDQNDIVDVNKGYSPFVSGGYYVEVQTKSWAAPNFSANCTETGPQGDWHIRCPAYLVNRLTFDGKSGGDGFNNHTALPSEAHGGPGVEDFRGGDGTDVFYGDADDDFRIDGRAGDDEVDGGAGHDTMWGGSGADTISWADAAGPVTASLDGQANDGVAGENEFIPTDFETLRGGAFDDTLYGKGAASDTLLGGGGADNLQGGGGDDVLRGEAGNDSMHLSAGSTVIDGGPDIDSLSFAGAGQSAYVYQDGVANDGLGGKDNVTSIEKLTGTSYGDDLEGTSGDDVIDGGGGGDKIDPKFGDDTVYGGEGPDMIIGGPGMPSDCGNLGCNKFDTDTVWGGEGSDRIDYSPRADKLTIAIDGSGKSGGYMENDDLHQMEDAVGGSGDDLIYGNDDPNSLNGGGGDDAIVARKGNDYVNGDEGNDHWLQGGAGNDFMVGGAGDDRLLAVGGNDSLYGASGRDLVSYEAATTGVVAHIGTGTSGPTGEADKIDKDVEDLEGSYYADKLYGNGAGNRLIGGAKADLLVGNGGADALEGGAGPDTLKTVGDAVKDQSSCGAAIDVADADAIDSVAADCETVNKS